MSLWAIVRATLSGSPVGVAGFSRFPIIARSEPTMPATPPGARSTRRCPPHSTSVDPLCVRAPALVGPAAFNRHERRSPPCRDQPGEADGRRSRPATIRLRPKRPSGRHSRSNSALDDPGRRAPGVHLDPPEGPPHAPATCERSDMGTIAAALLDTNDHGRHHAEVASGSASKTGRGDRVQPGQTMHQGRLAKPDGPMMAVNASTVRATMTATAIAAPPSRNSRVSRGCRS